MVFPKKLQLHVSPGDEFMDHMSLWLARNYCFTYFYIFLHISTCVVSLWLLSVVRIKNDRKLGSSNVLGRIWFLEHHAWANLWRRRKRPSKLASSINFEWCVASSIKRLPVRSRATPSQIVWRTSAYSMCPFQPAKSLNLNDGSVAYHRRHMTHHAKSRWSCKCTHNNFQTFKMFLAKQRYVSTKCCVNGMMIMRIPVFKPAHIHPCVVLCIAATTNATVRASRPPKTGLGQPFFFVLPIALPKNVVQGPALHIVLRDVVEHPANHTQPVELHKPRKG